MAKKTYIAVISIPAFSHQVSILEFCKRLINLHPHFRVTCIFPTIESPIDNTVTFLESLPSTIRITFLPAISKEDLSQDDSPAVQIQLAVSRSMPYFRNALESLCSITPFAALITDPFANETLEIAKDLNLFSYVYFPPSAMTLSQFLHFPKLHEEISCDFRDHKEEILLPGCVPIHGRDLPEHFQDRSSFGYDLFLQRCERFSLADGFLVNSFSEIEEGTVRALQESNSRGSPVYLVGPIIQTGSSNDPNGPESVNWLENQKPKSVIFVSFGSAGTLSQEQINELALGLELSGQKFLWVLRAPSDSSNAAYLGTGNDDPLKFLPNGFLKRTKKQGLVVPSWAPQAQILRHSSIGGFLSHCGWNSTLESIVLGVPMITWPLYAEQGLNAVLLTKGLKVALRPEFNENSIAPKEEIAKVIKCLMSDEQGKRIREKVQKLKDAAEDALKEDGSSTRALFQLGTHLETIGDSQ